MVREIFFPILIDVTIFMLTLAYMKLPIKTVALEQIDHEVTGEYIRVKRQAAGMSLRGLAKKMKVSAPYLSDLERANRKWTQALFDKALKYVL